MGSVKDAVRYLCVARGTRTLCLYTSGEQETENLAAMCLEKIPLHHKWYFETFGKMTFGFLMEDGSVHFAIVDKGFGSLEVLRFLENVGDEFKKVARRDSRGSFSSLSSPNVEEKLMPVIRQLISSLEQVSRSGHEWSATTSSADKLGLSQSPAGMNGSIDIASSTAAPLLGKTSKQDKKRIKDHVISVRDIELEEHRKSTDRGVKVESPALDSNKQTATGPPASSQKDFGSMRTRSVSERMRRRWWRHVRIILAIDVVVCLILFGVWLLICGGFACVR